LRVNQTLKEHRESDEMIDLVFMDNPDINVGIEWLLGDEVPESQSDVVYGDDDLGWLDVEEATGVVEPILNTRSEAALQKASVAFAAARPPRPKPSKSKEKGKQVAVVEEYDPKFVNDWGG